MAQTQAQRRKANARRKKAVEAKANGDGPAGPDALDPNAQQQQGGIPEDALWAKLGRVGMENDLLRNDVQILHSRNTALEEELARYKEEFGELDADEEAEPEAG